MKLLSLGRMVGVCYFKFKLNEVIELGQAEKEEEEEEEEEEEVQEAEAVQLHF